MEVAIRQQSLCLLLEGGVSRKSRTLRINCSFKTQFGNFMSGWISSENVFAAPTRLTEKRTTGTKVRNWAAMLSQIREKLNMPTDNEQLFRLKGMAKSPHSNPLLPDLAL